MKRILYIWQAGYPWDVRVEKICLALRDNGFDVTLMARWKPGQAEKESIDGIHVIRVGYGLPSQASIPLSANPLWYKAIYQTVRELRPSIIIPREILLTEAAARAARELHIPVIMDMAEHYPAAIREWKKYTGNPLLRFLVQTAKIPDYIEKKAVRASDGIITVCQENSDRLAVQYTYPVENLQVVNNTPSRALFNNFALSENPQPTRFAHHGFLTEERGLSTFLRGFSLAKNKYPSIELTLAGDGESYNELQSLVKDLKLADSVTLSGSYSYKDVLPMYEKTDIGVLPYRNDVFRNHSIPNKLFDYMACGKPLLVSQTKPTRRIVEETRAGIAVDCSQPETIAQGISNLLESDTISMGRNGRKAFLEQYNWEYDTAQLVQFIYRYL
jgi:glycosyltransferase involved in cell wall biosynthesis